MRIPPASLVVLALCAGCAAQRSLRVVSDPPGALVRLDGKPMGVTPLTIPFTYYGVRRLTLYKPGYHIHERRIELRAPWYGRFPLDIVSEVLLPIGWKDRRRYSAKLVAGEEIMSAPTLRSVIERADALRHAGPEGPRELPPPRTVELPPVEESEETPP